MFKIYDGRKSFYQWDLDRQLIVEDKEITEAHFSNLLTSKALVVEVKDGLVDVPNILLQSDFDIKVYGYDANHTKYCEEFQVIKRSKPEDYIYTEEEIKRYEDFEDRITALEEAEVNVDLSGYATQEYVDNALANVSEYISHEVKGSRSNYIVYDCYENTEYAIDWNLVATTPNGYNNTLNPNALGDFIDCMLMILSNANTSSVLSSSAYAFDSFKPLYEAGAVKHVFHIILPEYNNYDIYINYQGDTSISFVLKREGFYQGGYLLNDTANTITFNTFYFDGIDETLTLQRRMADAKAVGDRLAQLEARITALENT